MEKFSVDLDEIEAVAGKFVRVAEDVRGHVAWKYGIDTKRWPAGDPVRAAVVTYQTSLRAAMERLCDRSEHIASSLRDTADQYRAADESVVARLRELGAGEAR
ncbi:Excreted virulence factor EspC, type VII ESX diderm [Lentzea waywayandensis]|uniref:Excreted virulence factor EspC, type VII ESX diderm n=1 Tax=Lentzea waywayandensis TaxID=84724 RepID=A0A1I6FJD7_9PSEU|nr:type VII secretion target [Lentzea waywayandensis]SFR30004.1 Excreted virulence factor EspC, type VII ESX diderm [Lentzea waywayandensis]